MSRLCAAVHATYVAGWMDRYPKTCWVRTNAAPEQTESVSIASFRLFRPTPWMRNASAREIRFLSARPGRSRRRTTSVPSARRIAPVSDASLPRLIRDASLWGSNPYPAFLYESGKDPYYDAIMERSVPVDMGHLVQLARPAGWTSMAADAAAHRGGPTLERRPAVGSRSEDTARVCGARPPRSRHHRRHGRSHRRGPDPEPRRRRSRFPLRSSTRGSDSRRAVPQSISFART